MVTFGDAHPGSGSSVGVRIAIDQGRFGWQVFHDLRDGRVISRIDQYAVVDMRNAVNYRKPGFHRDTSWLGLLQSNRDLMMEGRLFARDGGLYYAEKLTDFKFNPRGDLRMMSTVYCGPIRVARFGLRLTVRPGIGRPRRRLLRLSHWRRRLRFNRSQSRQRVRRLATLSRFWWRMAALKLR
jgi:hypothetical protein